MKLSKHGLSLLMITLLLGLGCYNPEPFTGGVLVTTEEELAEMPNTSLPTPGVPDTGNASNGDRFAGFTDAGGRDVHPFASTNVNWTVVASFSVVVAACADLTNSGYVPSGGGQFDFKCIFV